MDMNFSRESVFTTAVRMFLGAFFGIVGAFIAFGVMFGIFGFLKPTVVPERTTVTIAEDANWSKKILPDSAPVILRIDINGVIGVGKFKAKNVRAQLISAVDRYVDTKRMKGIFLVLDTPGGSAIDSNIIYESILEFKERYNVPVFTYVEGMCASGGMYIACASDKIYASSSAVIGSVGVRIGPVLGFTGLMNQYGVDAVTITQGKFKDMLNPTKPFDPRNYQSLTTLVKDDYEQFVDIVVKSRKKMSRERLVNEYGAQVYSVEKALNYGYIDYANMSYSQALTALTKAAGIPEDTKYQVVQLQTTNTLLKDLFEEESLLRKGKIVHTFSFPSQMDPELWNKVLYLYDPSAESAAAE